MLNCKEITQHAQDYLNKDLPFFKRLEIRMHLFICSHCKRYLKQYEVTKAVVKNLYANKSDRLFDYKATWSKIQSSTTTTSQDSKPNPLE